MIRLKISVKIKDGITLDEAKELRQELLVDDLRIRIWVSGKDANPEELHDNGTVCEHETED